MPSKGLLCELPGSQLSPFELDTSVFSGPRAATDSPPQEDQASPLPYSWGLDYLSDSLYEAQLPLSFGGTGAYVAGKYSVLGTVKDSSEYSEASESESKRNHLDSIPEFLRCGRQHNQTQDNGASHSGNSGQVTAESSANPGGRQQNTKGKEKASNLGPRDNTPNGDDGEDDGDGNNRKRKRFRSPPRGQDRRRFACPYNRHDPKTYGVGDRRYLVCAGTGFRYISELM